MLMPAPEKQGQGTKTSGSSSAIQGNLGYMDPVSEQNRKDRRQAREKGRRESVITYVGYKSILNYKKCESHFKDNMTFAPFRS